MAGAGEERYRVLAEAAREGIAVHDRGAILEVNDAFCRLFGYARDEVLGRCPLSFIAPEARPDAAHRATAGYAQPYESVGLRKDGSTFAVELQGREIVYLGRPARVGIVRDITERKEREQELRRREAEYRAIFEAGEAAKAEVDPVTARFLRVNGACCDLLGYAEEELLGKTVWDLTHPEDRERDQASFARMPSGEIGRFQHEKRCIRKDGRTIWAHVSAVLLRDASGLPLRTILLAQDITERKLAEERLREREARLRSILETAPEAIIAIDELGLVTSFSPAAERLFGYAAEEVLGRNVSLLMPSPHAEAHDRYLARYRATGERRIIGIGREVEGRRKDGTIFPIELAVGEARANGERFFTGFVRDLTARRRMEQELRQAQKMEAVGQLTGGVAHDFNNLLTVVLGNLEMLEDRLTDQEDAALLRDAREAALLGAELTRRLLAFGRRQPLRPQVIDPGEAVPAAVVLLRRTLGETIEVATILAPDVPRIMADPGQLQNALLNLAINARDAMPEGGRLTIEAAGAELDADIAAARPGLRPGRYVMLAVSDTGTGMPPEIRERAFEPFFTTKGPGGGSGLGLSMVYGFVKQSGGHIDLYSEAGRGTVVKLYLPRAQEGGGGGEPAPQSHASLWPGRGETVLVVEDDAAVRRVTVARLKDLGYRVLEAADGPAALTLLEQHPGVDLLFTDMVMPGGMSGAALAEVARARHPAIAVLVASGYAAPESLKDLPAGAAWLNKPYTAAELARTLRSMLER